MCKREKEKSEICVTIVRHRPPLKLVFVRGKKKRWVIWRSGWWWGFILSTRQQRVFLRDLRSSIGIVLWTMLHCTVIQCTALHCDIQCTIQCRVDGRAWQGAWVTPCPRLYWPPTHFYPLLFVFVYCFVFLYLYFCVRIFVFGIFCSYFCLCTPVCGGHPPTSTLLSWKWFWMHELPIISNFFSFLQVCSLLVSFIKIGKEKIWLYNCFHLRRGLFEHWICIFEEDT